MTLKDTLMSIKYKYTIPKDRKKLYDLVSSIASLELLAHECEHKYKSMEIEGCTNVKQLKKIDELKLKSENARLYKERLIKDNIKDSYKYNQIVEYITPKEGSKSQYFEDKWNFRLNKKTGMAVVAAVGSVALFTAGIAGIAATAIVDKVVESVDFVDWFMGFFLGGIGGGAVLANIGELGIIDVDISEKDEKCVLAKELKWLKEHKEELTGESEKESDDMSK